MNIELIKEDDWYRNTLFWTPDTFLRQFRLFFPLICDVWKRTEHVVVEGPSKGGLALANHDEHILDKSQQANKYGALGGSGTHSVLFSVSCCNF